MTRKYSLILALFLLCGEAFAQNQWTLKSCIEYAIENNLEIKSKEIETQQAKINVHSAKYARLPNLNGSASQSFNWGRAASPVDNTYSNTNNASSNFSLSTNVPLFTGFELSNKFAVSKLNLQASIEDLAKAKEDISVRVTSAFTQVLYNYELLKIAEEQQILSQTQMERIKEMYKLGKASLAELSEADSRVAQDHLSKTEANNNYRISLLDLSQLLELPSPDNFDIVKPNTDQVEFAPITPPETIYSTALAIKPEIRAARLRVLSSAKNIKVARSGYFPKLSFGAGLGTSYYTVSGGTADPFHDQIKNNFSKNIGFTLSIPLFNRFATRNQIKSAKLQRINYQIQLDNTKKTLYKEIQQAWYSALAAQSKFQSSTKAVEANESSFNLMREKYENGKANSVEYNEAKLNLMRALSNKVQAKYEYIFRSKVLNFYKGIPIE